MISTWVFLAISGHSIAWGVEYGQTLCSPKSAEEKLIRMATVRLVVEKNGKYEVFCSGVLTDSSEVMTAGHCADEEPYGEGLVFAEIFDPSTPKNSSPKYLRVQISAFKKIYDLNPNGRDLALLRLAKDVRGASVPLALSGCDDKNRTAAGFGLTETGNVSPCPKLATYSEVEASEQSRVMAHKFEQGRYLTDELDFAQNYSKNWSTARSQNGVSCNIDSGGPVFCKSKGRLALFAVHSSAYRPPATFPRDKERGFPLSEMKQMMTYKCQLERYNTDTRISNSLDMIRSWRNELRVPTAQVPSDAPTAR